jgi:hypothetical protein
MVLNGDKTAAQGRTDIILNLEGSKTGLILLP